MAITAPTLEVVGLLAPTVTASRERTFAGAALVVANPAAGGVTAELVDELVARLRSHSARVEVAWTANAGDTTARAAQAGGDPDVGLIVAVGGDGTAREVAEGLAGRPGSPSAPLLVLPAGSGNSTARNLWGELAWAEVIDAAFDPARSQIRTIDLLHVSEPDRLAVLGASTGFLPAALLAARQVSGLRGMDRYHAAAAAVLADMPSEPTVVRVDGVTVHDGPVCLAAVGGGRYRARSCLFLPLSVLDDGLLDVCVIAELRGAALAEVAGRAQRGEHLGCGEVTYARGRRVTIEHRDGRPLLAESDGDVWAGAGSTMTIEVRPGALCVLSASDQPGG
jgi:diacylglycerol kinase (ATP)